MRRILITAIAAMLMVSFSAPAFSFGRGGKNHAPFSYQMHGPSRHQPSFGRAHFPSYGGIFYRASYNRHLALRHRNHIQFIRLLLLKEIWLHHLCRHGGYHGVGLGHVKHCPVSPH